MQCAVLCICEFGCVGKNKKKKDRERTWRFTCMDINSLHPCVPMNRNNIHKT